MATAVSPSSPPSPELARFEEFAEAVGLALEPFQREVLEAVFTGRRELLVMVPRGAGKTTLFAALALFGLLTTAEPAIYIGAASRDQASLLFDIARRMVGRHPEIERRVTVRHREMALRTAMLKRPGSQMVTISTAGVGAESPLGRLRTRALALPDVEREGALTRATGPSFGMLEWAVADDADLDDMAVVKAANPASWITEEGLREQREAVHPLAFARYHANQWTAVEHHWLPPGTWSSCAADYTIEPGEAVWMGVDIGGSRAASALVWLTEDLRVGSAIYQGDEAVLAVVEKVRALADEFDVREVWFDPWRFQAPALDLEQEGMVVVEFPQSQVRMVPASERLYAAVVEGRLKHSNDPELNAHVAGAIAAQTPRGWKLEKSARSAQIDGVVALAMAVEAAERRPAPVELVGWL